MKNKNYKYIIGIITGLLLVSCVYGVDSIISSIVLYDSTNSYYSNGNVKGAIDDLAEKIDKLKPTSCIDGYYCEPYKDTLALGDYVEYTPVVESYDVDTSMTGYTGTDTQIIYPSELNLWRVLNIYEDGRVDLISEYVSSTDVYFQGKKGYLNFVGYLNDLAEQYETEGITDETNGSRYFGYNGQIEYLEDTEPSKIFVNPAPWSCSTGQSGCTTDESLGGGDSLYTTDYNQLQTALGLSVAYKVGTTTATSYWMASRYYSFSSSTLYLWYGRIVSTSGSLGYNYLYRYSSGSFYESSCNTALRPIVTLKSGLLYGGGIGTEKSPMKIITG